MKLSTMLSAAVAVLGAAGLVLGFTLSPGVAASFGDEATVGASISVADALDCDGDPQDGIGCPEPEMRGFTFQTNTLMTEVDGNEVTLTATFSLPPETDASAATATFEIDGDKSLIVAAQCELDAELGTCTAEYTVTLEPDEYRATATLDWGEDTLAAGPEEFTIKKGPTSDPEPASEKNSPSPSESTPAPPDPAEQGGEPGDESEPPNPDDPGESEPTTTTETTTPSEPAEE